MTVQPDDDDFHSTHNQKDWPHDLSALQKIGEEILERYAQDQPQSPRAYPTAEWLRANGYSHLRYILRQYHDMGLAEFFTLLTSAQSTGFDWDIDAVATVERAETFITSKSTDRRWADSTEKRFRYILNQMFKQYKERTNSGDLYALAQDRTTHQEIYETFLVIVRSLRETKGSDESAYKYLRLLQRWFEWLERPGRIPDNPIEDLEKEFDWNWGSDTESLTESQVRKLWNQAQTIPEYLLVIGYCIWGLRTQELAQVRVEQFVFDPDDPRIEFTTEDSRKNGIGSVTLLFGLTVLASRLDRLRQNDEWNGYLFPGDTDGHRHAATLRRRFKTLCKEANITVEGETPTPRDGRSYYYNILGKAETTLLERVSEFAPEQGSKDPETIVERYLDEETRRQYRRVFFRWHQRNALPDDAFNGSPELGPHLTSLDDYISIGHPSQDDNTEGDN